MAVTLPPPRPEQQTRNRSAPLLLNLIHPSRTEHGPGLVGWAAAAAGLRCLSPPSLALSSTDSTLGLLPRAFAFPPVSGLHRRAHCRCQFFDPEPASRKKSWHTFEPASIIPGPLYLRHETSPCLRGGGVPSRLSPKI